MLSWRLLAWPSGQRTSCAPKAITRPPMPACRQVFHAAYRDEHFLMKPAIDWHSQLVQREVALRAPAAAALLTWVLVSSFPAAGAHRGAGAHRQLD